MASEVIEASKSAREAVAGQSSGLKVARYLAHKRFGLLTPLLSQGRRFIDERVQDVSTLDCSRKLRFSPLLNLVSLWVSISTVGLTPHSIRALAEYQQQKNRGEGVQEPCRAME
jgi:hypothetical protein